MTTVANASVVFKDKNGNVGTVKGASANDITKISNAISDVAQVVNPTTHLPISATTSSVGVVQLADSTAVASGTSGRVVDAAQLKAVSDAIPSLANVVDLSSAQTITGVKTFSSLPESSVAPTTNNQLANKKYVDDHVPVITNMVTTDGAQTITGVKTFSALPQSSVAPTGNNDLVNKAYVDAHSGGGGLGDYVPGQIIVSSVPQTDARLHLADGALLSGAGTYADFVDFIEELYNSGGTAASSFCTESQWQQAVTDFGCCNKYVYDSTNNTVRLPKRTTEHGALVKSYHNGTDWYRIYSDGWCEQGGNAARASTDTAVTLFKPYINTNYIIQLSTRITGTGSGMSNTCWYNQTVSSFTVKFDHTSGDRNDGGSWSTCGYIDTTNLQITPIYEYIVIGTVTKTQIQVDIDEIVTDLNGKADVDLSNVTLATLKNKLLLEYNTGYFSVAASGKYSFDLTGTGFDTIIDKSKIIASVRAIVTTASDGYAVGDIIDLGYANFIGSTGNSETGLTVAYIGSNTLSVFIGNNVQWYSASPNSAYAGISKSDTQLIVHLTYIKSN